MPARTLPNLGLTGFFDLGEEGWDDEMSLNLLTLSVLTQGRVLSKVAAEPGSPDDGDVHILDETHATQANKVAIRDAGAWVYVTPFSGWLLYNVAADYYEKFDGAAWAELEMSGSGGVSDAPSNGKTYGRKDGAWEAVSAPTESIIVALGDETTIITAGTAKVTIRVPYGFTLTAVRASLTTASSSGLVTVDINEGGVSILSTKLTIDAGENTSTTAATPAVISDSNLADDAEVTFDIDTAGTGAKGLKVYMIGHR